MSKRRETVIINLENKEVDELGECYLLAKQNDSTKIKDFYQNKPLDFFTLPLNPSGDTVFHVAAYMGSGDSLQALFDMVPDVDNMKQKVLQKTNVYGNTLIHELATAPNNAVKIFLNSNTRLLSQRHLLETRNDIGETPLFRAAAHGDFDTFKWLVQNVSEVATGDLYDHFRRSSDGLTILHIAVINEQFETAIWLLKMYPELGGIKDREHKTCIHLLASMPTAFGSSSKMDALEKTIYDLIPDTLIIRDLVDRNVQLDQNNQPNERTNCVATDSKISLSNICNRLEDRGYIRRIRDLKRKHYLAVAMVKVLLRNSGDFHGFGMKVFPVNESGGGGAQVVSVSPLITAARSGIKEIVEEILHVYPQAIEHVTEEGLNIMHVAVLNRHLWIFTLLDKCDKVTKNRLAQGIDDIGDTVLHKAAYTTYSTSGTRETASPRLIDDLKYFKKLEDEVPEHYKNLRNKNKVTAEEVFAMEHRDQLKDAQKWVKSTCQACSAVAVLVATVLFTVAFNTPDDDKLESLTEYKMIIYTFLAIMYGGGLSSSLMAVLLFTSILKSTLDLHDFRETIPRKLKFGVGLLIYAVVCSILSYMVAILLNAYLTSPFSWTKVLTYLIASIPIGIYAWANYKLYHEYMQRSLAYVINRLVVITGISR